MHRVHFDLATGIRTEVPYTAEEEAAHAAALAAANALPVRKEALKQRVNVARAAAIYANITIPFPVAEKEVQFRNEQDEKNLTVKVLGAQIMVYRGAPESVVQFTCADNSIATMTAEEFVDVGLAVLAAKEAIFYSFKAVKDMIESAADDEGLAAAAAALEVLID